MNLQTRDLAAVIKPLVHLVAEATVVKRHRDVIRIYRPESDESLLDRTAIRDILEAGLKVRVFAGSFISTGYLVDGFVRWDYRVTPKYRDKVVVEISQ